MKMKNSLSHSDDYEINSQDTESGCNFPGIQKAAHIVKLLSAIFIVVFFAFTILAYATDGGIFFLKKTEAVITEVKENKTNVYTAQGNYTETSYDITLEYNYNGENNTMCGTSKSPKKENDTVYIYVNKLNPSSVWYIDGFGMVTKLVAIGISIFAILFIISITIENYGINKFTHEFDP